ncbi:hypothetical protein PSACC_03571 [Paramicrosporidium saccamoebae]|uniref:Protein SAE3 homolog n=1 Tax=Paramicrosporidium saccamoebae TaxID=1246581 RepID=A0A2H9TFV8_9FUNG|nr:hypothetical protein PSACC_03571 [Paramicrosporidium saccamoebae]
MYACKVGDLPPEGTAPVPGEYHLESGETVILYKIEPETARLRAELEETVQSCTLLATELGYYLSPCVLILNSIKDAEEENRRTKELIEKLHKYNEYKDLAQALIGRLAVLEGCITRELYPRFDLELDD